MKEYDPKDFEFVKVWRVGPAANGWIELFEFRPEGYKSRKAHLLEFRKIEDVLKEKGYRGWLTWTKVDYFHIHRLLDRVEAVPYYYDGEKIFFYKEINKETGVNNVQQEEKTISGSNSGS